MLHTLVPSGFWLTMALRQKPLARLVGKLVASIIDGTVLPIDQSSAAINIVG
jgi:hypothetical protein